MKEINLITPPPNVHGEISNEDFITYENIASLAGVTQGTLANEGSGWLRFELDDMELIVAKKNVRNVISWNHLNSVGCVFGEKIVTIGGNQYKVRLLKGANTDPTPYIKAEHYSELARNSEWDRLFYPIITDDPYIPADKQGTHGNYRVEDLALASSGYTWCQEITDDGTGRRILRGHNGASLFYSFRPGAADWSALWRPCLELIK